MIQSRRQDEVPKEQGMTIDELARRQGIEPVSSLDVLIPWEPLFDSDDLASFGCGPESFATLNSCPAPEGAKAQTPKPLSSG